jgi:hypothetical protein
MSFQSLNCAYRFTVRDPFPGIEPRKGHTEACLAARRNIPSSKGYSSGRPVDRDRSAGPAPRVVGGSPTVKAEPMTNSQRKMVSNMQIVFVLSNDRFMLGPYG